MGVTVLVLPAARPLPFPLPAEPDLLRGLGLLSTLSPGDSLPPGWAPLDLDRGRTLYRIVDDAQRGRCLRAEAEGEASGLQLQLEGEARRGRFLTWSWRSAGPVPGADLSARSGDDAPARVTVSFDLEAGASRLERLRHRIARARFGNDVPARAISYAWGNREPRGAVLPGAYTDRVRIVVLRSGEDPAGTWFEEGRDLAADYRELFGGEPPDLLGIGILTDGDDTGGRASACYGDLRLGQGAPSTPSLP